jgi:periplasmic divalent cation tolerance protein
MDALLVFTTCPDETSARRIAETLIAQRLAACVNIGAPMVSLYHWRGAIENTTEIPLTIKTLRTRYEELEATLLRLHPYELPEVVAVPIMDGHRAYLDWIAAEATGSGD